MIHLTRTSSCRVRTKILECILNYWESTTKTSRRRCREEEDITMRDVARRRTSQGETCKKEASQGGGHREEEMSRGRGHHEEKMLRGEGRREEEASNGMYKIGDLSILLGPRGN
jgi:hypothetical protein